MSGQTLYEADILLWSEQQAEIIRQLGKTRRSLPNAHWRGEIVGFHAALLDRYSPSMRQHLDTDDSWRSVCEQAAVRYEGAMQEAVRALPDRSPLALDDLLARRIDSAALVARIVEAGLSRDTEGSA